MTKLALLLVVLGAWFAGINQIARSNALKQKAWVAYNQQQYPEAAAAWQQLLQISPGPDAAVHLNLAHALRRQNQKAKAAREYQQVIRTGNAELKSVAYLQLGNMLAQAKEYDQALKAYQDALKADVRNHHARYNYELLKKHQKQQETSEEEEENPEPENGAAQQQQQSRQSRQGGQNTARQPGSSGQPNPMNQGAGSGTGQGQNRDTEDPAQNRPPNVPPQTGQKAALPGEETSVRRLEQIRMSEDRARALLEAMRNAELQYLQQLPRQQEGRANPNKPDW